MIGVLTTPDGNSVDQAKVLRVKAEKWSQALKSQSLYQHEALLAYHHALMPEFKYTLGASLLQESQCDHI